MLRSLIIPLVLLGCIFPASNNTYAYEKPNLIITTDIGGDPDDTQSLTRLLLYSNEFNLLGLIASASGTRGELDKDTIRPDLIYKHIDAYEKVLPNLRKHDPAYPGANVLRYIVKRGNPHRGINNIGKGRDTEGSDWIIQEVDNSENKVNISIWGGQTDVVQALWKVKNERSYNDYFSFVNKIRIYDINDQDAMYTYILEEFPELFYILAKAQEGKDKREGAYRGMYLGGDISTTSLEWIEKNVIHGHGPLGKLYPSKTWTDPNPHGALKEGDTPSWFYFLQNGLQDPGHPEYGGFGGRFHSAKNMFYRDDADFAGGDIEATASVYRWRPYFQAAFENRMDWCVNSPEKVNHAPVLVVNGDKTKNIIYIDVEEGGTLTINTIGSDDVDGDSLTYSWWIYPEAGTARQCPEMWPIDQPDVALEIPDGEAGKQMHLIFQVSDDGNPVLTSFRRIVLNIKPAV